MSTSRAGYDLTPLPSDRIAALAAEGSSTIHNVGQIERGYERIDERLRALGAEIERAE